MVRMLVLCLADDPNAIATAQAAFAAAKEAGVDAAIKRAPGLTADVPSMVGQLDAAATVADHDAIIIVCPSPDDLPRYADNEQLQQFHRDLDDLYASGAIAHTVGAVFPVSASADQPSMDELDRVRQRVRDVAQAASPDPKLVIDHVTGDL